MFGVASLFLGIVDLLKEPVNKTELLIILSCFLSPVDFMYHNLNWNLIYYPDSIKTQTSHTVPF